MGTGKSGESRKTVRVFAAATFLNDMGSDMIYPIWPLFVTTVMGANMAILGLIDGLGDAVVSISQAASGYLSDKYRKRKIFIWTGYLFGGISRIGYAFSRSWPQLVPFRVLDRAGKIRGAPRDAIIADVSTRANRGSNFGVMRMMDNLGAVVGILITLFLAGYLSYQKIFLIAAIPSLIGMALILLFIKERRTKKISKGISFHNLDLNLKLFLVISAIFALGSFSYSFLLVYASKFGFPAAFIPILYLVFTAIAAILSLPFGKLADLIGRKKVMQLSFLFFALMCAGFVMLKSSLGLILMFVLYGMHRAAIEPVQRAFVSELSPQRYRASTLGAYQMVIGLMALPASIIAGVLWDHLGAVVPFIFSLALSAIAFLLLFFVREK